MLKTLIGAAAALTLLATSAVAEMKRLLPAADLSALSGAVHILDIRAPAGENSYASGHIAGSISAPYGLFRGPKANPGQLLTDGEVSMLLRAKGVKRDLPTVVVYHGASPTEFGAAARVYWTLKSAGVKQIAILDGGVKAWIAAGLPLTETPTIARPSAIRTTLSTEWMASRDDIKAISGGAQDGTLVDARPAAFLKGEKKHPAAKVAGTLKGATQFTHANWFADGASKIGQPEGLLGIYRKPDGPGPIVSFCNTGHWAATNWFMMSEIQRLPNVKLYPESMVGWTNAGGSVVTQ